MNTLEQIHEMWKKDCLIDKMDLDKSARDSAKLHSKYLELYSVNKLKYKKLDNDFKVLLKNKWLHYNGKLSKEEIDKIEIGNSNINIFLKLNYILMKN